MGVGQNVTISYMEDYGKYPISQISRKLNACANSVYHVFLLLLLEHLGIQSNIVYTVEKSVILTITILAIDAYTHHRSLHSPQELTLTTGAYTHHRSLHSPQELMSRPGYLPLPDIEYCMCARPHCACIL